MSLSDPLGDMLTRIRNGQHARMSTVESPASKLRSNVLEVLKREGYIRGYSQEEVRPGVANLRIELKYHEGEPVIKQIARVSKPGRRVYSKIADLPRFYNGLGIQILSTPRGVMSDNEARAQNVAAKCFAACSKRLTCRELANILCRSRLALT
jgi:small subunit ribosomal protein S8